MKTNQFKNNQKVISKSYSQRGLSLIELLIAMVIGLFLMGGLITSFISTKNSDKTREITSEMDASAQTALNVLRQAITHAGYPSIENIELAKGFVTTKDFPPISVNNTEIDNPDCNDGIARDITSPLYKNRTRDYGIRDKLMVVSLADNPSNADALVYYDCTGGGMTRTAHDIACSTENMDNKREAKIFSNFRVNRTDGVPILYCDGSRGGGQPIANNVYAIQYLYGVRQDTGTTVYKTANKVEVDDQWGLVNSVQIGLLMQSEKQNVLAEPGQASYRLLNKSIVINSAQRRRIYRIYTTTVNIENMNKAPLL